MKGETRNVNAAVSVFLEIKHLIGRRKKIEMSKHSVSQFTFYASRSTQTVCPKQVKYVESIECDMPDS